LEFLELSHLAARLLGLALLTIVTGNSEVCLRRERGVFLEFD
jgi:hypothetical protein